MPLSRADLAQLIDHTLLAPTATCEEVEALIEEAQRLGTYSICVSPSMLPVQSPRGDVKVATVCGFPSGKHTPEVKAYEAGQAAAAGADEIDMVIDVGRLIDGDATYTESEIRTVRDAVPNVVLKVIIESAALTDEQIVLACKAAESAGADFVKTSTGFHPRGGASEHAVKIMADTVGGRLGVKASGGIRTYEDAQKMVDAGATRLGLSASAAVLDGAED